jgi:Fe-Mn family superoxide dismutase
MSFTLPNLPFAKDALAPHMSAETFEYHHEKHHNAYIQKANELIAGSGLEGLSLEEATIAASKDPKHAGLFNQLGQHYNHSLFWNSLSPNGGGKDLPEPLANKVIEAFGSIDAFLEEFQKKGMGQFGSGWVWLVLDNATKKLEIATTLNAHTPLTENKTPLLVCDVWEHAYYIDYRNARPKFLSTFVEKLANWAFANDQLTKSL